MCGILGFFECRGEVSLQRSGAALDLLYHRGPDAFGWSYGDTESDQLCIEHNRKELNGESAGWFLGHRRLSIVDLSDAAVQPMIDRERGVLTVFNGEIYNHRSLRRELERKGHRFVTDHSDTEVLLRSYIEYGQDCVDRFVGMFAFAILDLKEGLLFLARDRIGQKPLYFHHERGRFWFSSELTPLVEYRGKPVAIDQQAVHLYLRYGYIPAPTTIYRGFSKLLPGHCGTYDLTHGEFQVRQYWDIPMYETVWSTRAGTERKAQELVREAVAIRESTDVPMAVCTSGGIDSTVVVMMLKGSFSQPVKGYGVDFPFEALSERNYIEEVGRVCDLDIHLENIDERYFSRLDDLVGCLDEPFDAGSLVSLYGLCSTIEEKVIYTGDGGDEIFCGYPRYLHFLDWLLKQPRAQHSNGWFEALNSWREGTVFERGLHRHRYRAFAESLTDEFVNRYYRSKLPELQIDQNVNTRFYRDLVKIDLGEPLKTLQYLELKTIVPGRMLFKVDRVSMRFHQEARSPLLDHRLIEFAFKVPRRFMVRGDRMKLIPKKILEQLFPASFVDRQKKGFGNPFPVWFKRLAGAELLGPLRRKESPIYSLLDFEKTEKLFPEIWDDASVDLPGKRLKELFSLLFFHLFLEQKKKYLTLS